MPQLDTVLLFSLPASGKSEVRTYMASLTEEQCRRDFGMGPTLQLDDYPYVHLMRCVDAALVSMGHKRVYFLGADRPFLNLWGWAVLTELLNEDYARLLSQSPYVARSAAELFFERFDAAHQKFGMPEVLGELPHRLYKTLAKHLEKEAERELSLLNHTLVQSRAGRTIVIEAARGGPNGAAFPLTPPFGYATAFDVLSPTILSRASVLYIWVDPAESRRKNIERGRPNAQGSILHHCVPMEVMLSQYGTDDMSYLMEQSDRPGTVRIDRTLSKPAGHNSGHNSGHDSGHDSVYETRSFYLPVARFDNREDKTTFVRLPRSEWPQKDMDALHTGLAQAFARLSPISSSAPSSPVSSSAA